MDAVCCRSCGEALPRPDEVACPACQALQPPAPGRDHFQVMGVARSVRADDAELARIFREKSRLLHPDRHVRGPAGNRRLALEHTTALNDAYRVLRDPARRAEYLLSLLGVAVDERTGARDEAFLMEVMELREQVEAARADAGAAARLTESLAAEIAACLTAIDGATRTATDPLEGPARAAASAALVRLKYMESARKDLAARASGEVPVP